MLREEPEVFHNNRGESQGETERGGDGGDGGDGDGKGDDLYYACLGNCSKHTT